MSTIQSNTGSYRSTGTLVRRTSSKKIIRKIPQRVIHYQIITISGKDYRQIVTDYIPRKKIVRLRKMMEADLV